MHPAYKEGYMSPSHQRRFPAIPVETLFRTWAHWPVRILVLAAALMGVPLHAQVVVDKTCASCGRRQLDSLNLFPRHIRVN